MPTTISPAGRAALMRREGCRLNTYLDGAGVPTIGVGHTGRAAPPAVTLGMRITPEEAEAIFARDLAPFEEAVCRAVTVPLGVNQFDACVSLAFNIGARGFAGSTVAHKLDAGDVAGAADAFLMWVHPPELLRRREGERAQFLRPDDPGAAAPPVAAFTAAPPTAPRVPPRPAAPGVWTRLLAIVRKAA